MPCLGEQESKTGDDREQSNTGVEEYISLAQAVLAVDTFTE